MSTDAFTTGDGCTVRLTKFDIASILSSRWRAAVVIVGLCWVKHQSPLYRVRFFSRLIVRVVFLCDSIKLGARTYCPYLFPATNPVYLKLRRSILVMYRSAPFLQGFKKKTSLPCTTLPAQRLIHNDLFLAPFVKKLGIVNRSHRSRLNLRICSNVTGSACS